MNKLADASGDADLKLALELDCSAMQCSTMRCGHPELVAKVHGAGLYQQLHRQRPMGVQRPIDLGTDGIITDRGICSVPRRQAISCNQ